ncbi:MAG: DUF1934 domain-containing protein [Pseudoflavonifractor sp.]
MDKSVIISVSAKQSFEDAEDETVELVTEGVLACEGGGDFTLSYQESELTGMQGTLTTFQVEGQRITLLRMGEYNSQMVFEPGRKHLSYYNTPYGTLSIGVNTNRMQAALDEHGGQITIDYGIEVDHAMAGRNLFQIDIREKESAIKQ